MSPSVYAANERVSLGLMEGNEEEIREVRSGEPSEV
jgi:hypothetical protein